MFREATLLMRKGFTLVDTLFLLAIVTALAAILLPVTSRIIGANKRKACLSNVRSISLALLQYSQDYDGRTPPGDAIAMQAHTHPWASIVPYIKDRDAFVCPSDRERNCCSLQAGVAGYWGAEWASFSCSYGYGMRTGSVVLKTISLPVMTLAMCEMIERPYADYVHSDCMSMDGRNRRYVTRHNDGMNIGYWDGHAGWVPEDRLSTIRLFP